MTFVQWMRLVDRYLLHHMGVSTRDIADRRVNDEEPFFEPDELLMRFNRLADQLRREESDE